MEDSYRTAAIGQEDAVTAGAGDSCQSGWFELKLADRFPLFSRTQQGVGKTELGRAYVLFLYVLEDDDPLGYV
jgi:hypothetical protein